MTLPRLPDRAELRQAVRSLTRTRGFLLVSAGSLSIGIAMSVTMFGVLDALIKPSIPVSRLGELHSVYWSSPPAWPVTSEEAFAKLRTLPIIESVSSSWSDFEMVFGPGGGQAGAQPDAVGALGATPTNAKAAAVATNLFDVLGTTPLHGRFFTAGDGRGAEGTAVISDPLYRRLYGDKPFAPFVLAHGSSVHTVIGVTRPRVERVLNGEIWTASSAAFNTRTLVVRVKPGVARADFGRMVAVVNQSLEAAAGRPSRDRAEFRAFPLLQRTRAAPLPTYGVTLAALAVLLIACANIANLQLARGLSRVRDLAVRVAVGASRGDVVRLLMTESLIVAVAGGAGGLLLSLWCMGAVRATLPAEFQRFGFVEPQMSWRLFGAAAGLTMLSAVVFGLAPALRVSKLDVNTILQSRAGTGTARGSRRQYTSLVALEVGGAMALVVCAALLVVSVRSFTALDYGYASRSILILRAGVQDSLVNQARGQAVALRNAIRARPEIAAAALSSMGTVDRHVVTTDDPDPARARKLWLRADRPVIVDADFFRTLGTRVAGPGFAVNDDGLDSKVVIDRVAARKLFGGVDPVGRMIKLGPPESARRWLRVVGVASHIRWSATQNSVVGEVNPQLWVLATPDSMPGRGDYGSISTGGGNFRTLRERLITVYVRPARDLAAGIGAIRATTQGLPRPGSVNLLDDINGRNALERTQRFIANLFVGFGAVGLALAMVGVYGVVAHSVSQRTREFGVRIAFGATPRHLAGLVLREGNVSLLVGLALGLVLARTGESVLAYFIDGFGDVRQIAVYAIAPSAMLVAALAATLAPAIRASRTDPVRAIRAD